MSKDVEEFAGARMARFWVRCIKFVDPIACLLILLYNIIKDIADGGYEGYPAGAQVFGW